MRFAVDSNILVYALIRDDGEKHRIAADIMIRGMLLDMVIPAQVLGEFLNVIRRKHPQHFDEAQRQARRWAELIPPLETSAEHMLSGAAFASAHKLQLWDAIIWKVVRGARAAIFLSEDMQDGFSHDGTTILNPMLPANDDKLRTLLEAGASAE